MNLNRNILHRGAEISRNAYVCDSILEEDSYVSRYCYLHNVRITRNSVINPGFMFGNPRKGPLPRITLTSHNHQMIGPLGRSDRFLSMAVDNGTLYLSTGCFCGTIDEFRAALARVYEPPINPCNWYNTVDIHLSDHVSRREHLRQDYLRALTYLEGWASAEIPPYEDPS